MGRPIKVTIDSDTLKEMFYDRVNYAEHWMKHYDDVEAFLQVIEELQAKYNENAVEQEEHQQEL